MQIFVHLRLYWATGWVQNILAVTQETLSLGEKKPIGFRYSNPVSVCVISSLLP